MVNTIVNQDKISKSGFSFPLGPQHLSEALLPSCLVKRLTLGSSTLWEN